MDFGTGGITSFPFVPDVVGPDGVNNRHLPDGERLSFMLRPMRAFDEMAETDDDDALLHWREAALSDLIGKDDPYKIRRFAVGVLRPLRLFAEHCTSVVNFTLDGEPVTDPRIVFLVCPIEAETHIEARALDIVGRLTEGVSDNVLAGIMADAKAIREEQERPGIVRQAIDAIKDTRKLSGEQLGKFVAQFGGSHAATTQTEPASQTASDAT